MRLIDIEKFDVFDLSGRSEEFANGVQWILEQLDNAPTVEPCYQTASCLDCKNYDKDKHACPRYCEVIKDALRSVGSERPKGEWKYACYPSLNKEIYYCSNCDIAFPIEYKLAKSINPENKELTVIQMDSRFNFCPCCGAKMYTKEDDNK